jgi:hypothetical protein
LWTMWESNPRTFLCKRKLHPSQHAHIKATYLFPISDLSMLYVQVALKTKTLILRDQGWISKL